MDAPPPPRLPGRGSRDTLLTMPEVAWPLGLLSGFVGTWAGLTARVPGLGALGGVLAFVALHATLLGRGRRSLAAAVALGWGGAVTAAVMGTVIELGFDKIHLALPFAASWDASQVAPWIDPDVRAPHLLSLGGMGVGLGVVAAMVALARVAHGVGALLAAALYLGAAGAGAGRVVALAMEHGGDPLFTSLVAFPPHVGLQVAGGLLIATVLADPAPVAAPGSTSGGTGRRLVLAGIALAVLGVLGEPLLRTLWGGWMEGAVNWSAPGAGQ